MKKMTYKQARELVSKHIKENHHKFIDDSECEATISHFLQSPAICPPFMPYKLFMECKDLLSGKKKALNDKVKKAAELAIEYQPNLQFVDDSIPFPPPATPKFTFIDLFAGIGGFRIAMQENGGKCVFSCEWDKYAKKTYEANFGETPYGDIRSFKVKNIPIPTHDVLCAGFPCQPFSLAGVSKKNSMGRKHGFEDETQGTLFFEIASIISEKRPKAFFLENVKNLFRHDKGKTFEIIRRTLVDELKYIVNWDIVDGSKWVPQHRERLFIVGYNPELINISKEEIIIPKIPEAGYKYPELSDIIQEKVGNQYTLGPGTWDTLERHKAHHAKVGNGFGYGLHKMPIKKGEITRTISARYHKDGAEILIEQKGKNPRRLTVEEAMQLQGYTPSKFHFPLSVSGTQAYRQIGNSVVVPAVTATAKEVSIVLKNNR